MLTDGDMLKKKKAEIIHGKESAFLISSLV